MVKLSIICSALSQAAYLWRMKLFIRRLNILPLMIVTTKGELSHVKKPRWATQVAQVALVWLHLLAMILWFLKKRCRSLSGTLQAFKKSPPLPFWVKLLTLSGEFYIIVDKYTLCNYVCKPIMCHSRSAVTLDHYNPKMVSFTGLFLHLLHSAHFFQWNVFSFTQWWNMTKIENFRDHLYTKNRYLVLIIL